MYVRWSGHSKPPSVLFRTYIMSLHTDSIWHFDTPLTQNIYNCFRLEKSREILLNLFYIIASGISAILENGAEGNRRFYLLFLWFASFHLVICVTSPRDLRLITAWNAISKRLRPNRWAPERWHFPAQNTIFVHHFPFTLTSKKHKLLSDSALTKSLKNALRWAKRFVFWKEAILNPPKFEYFLTILRAMRLLKHTFSSDVSIHLGGLVVKMILASDRITHAVPLGAARANTKHLHLYSLCSEIEKATQWKKHSRHCLGNSSQDRGSGKSAHRYGRS